MNKIILRESFDCEIMVIEYTGIRKDREFKRTYLIPCKSLYERIVCDILDRGIGINHATLLINLNLTNDGLQEVGASCVRDTYHRLFSAIMSIRKVSMGTNEAHSS